jgi:hypothetical protein
MYVKSLRFDTNSERSNKLVNALFASAETVSIINMAAPNLTSWTLRRPNTFVNNGGAEMAEFSSDQSVRHDYMYISLLTYIYI